VTRAAVAPDETNLGCASVPNATRTRGTMKAMTSGSGDRHERDESVFALAKLGEWFLVPRTNTTGTGWITKTQHRQITRVTARRGYPSRQAVA